MYVTFYIHSLWGREVYLTSAARRVWCILKFSCLGECIDWKHSFHIYVLGRCRHWTGHPREIVQKLYHKMSCCLFSWDEDIVNFIQFHGKTFCLHWMVSKSFTFFYSLLDILILFLIWKYCPRERMMLHYKLQTLFRNRFYKKFC